MLCAASRNFYSLFSEAKLLIRVLSSIWHCQNTSNDLAFFVYIMSLIGCHPCIDSIDPKPSHFQSCRMAGTVSFHINYSRVLFKAFSPSVVAARSVFQLYLQLHLLSLHFICSHIFSANPLRHIILWSTCNGNSIISRPHATKNYSMLSFSVLFSKCSGNTKVVDQLSTKQLM